MNDKGYDSVGQQKIGLDNKDGVGLDSIGLDKNDRIGLDSIGYKWIQKTKDRQDQIEQITVQQTTKM